ncbi:MAG TPA: hypothetical protein VG649_11095 [Candidatus Angelobacter sp.]|nr:hypothetical protein [Candidatus Angelobacter sp.]
MTFTRAIILVVLCCCTIILSAARSNQDKPNPDTSLAGQNDQDQNDQNQALRNDLTRMKSLVQQMEQNLAFVDTTQSPLKHQFQLEIDMWRTMINQMERRLQSRTHANQVK